MYPGNRTFEELNDGEKDHAIDGRARQLMKSRQFMPSVRGLAQRAEQAWQQAVRELLSESREEARKAAEEKLITDTFKRLADQKRASEKRARGTPRTA